jgi:hypothetical protein
METKTRARFMDGKSEESSELIGNQELESAFAALGQNRHDPSTRRSTFYA